MFVFKTNFISKIFKLNKYPEILIKHGRLIDHVFIFYCQNSPDLKKSGWNDWIPPTKENLDKRIKVYKEEWTKYNIVKDISKLLGISFERNIIDVHIVSGVSRATSHPIILKSGFKPKEFVVTLAHELIHVILTDNKIKKIVFDEKASKTTNNHVIVFAVLKKILDQELWDIEVRATKSPDYLKALELSEKIGVDKVIEMMMGR